MGGRKSDSATPPTTQTANLIGSAIKGIIKEAHVHLCDFDVNGKTDFEGDMTLLGCEFSQNDSGDVDVDRGAYEYQP